MILGLMVLRITIHGPLANPKHYSGMRYFYNISELKPLPISNVIGWDNINEFLCALPINEQPYININSLEEEMEFFWHQHLKISPWTMLNI